MNELLVKTQPYINYEEKLIGEEIQKNKPSIKGGINKHYEDKYKDNGKFRGLFSEYSPGTYLGT